MNIEPRLAQPLYPVGYKNQQKECRSPRRHSATPFSDAATSIASNPRLALPDDSMLEIFDRISSDDLLSWGQADKKLWEKMPEHFKAARCNQQAKAVKDLTQFREVLGIKSLAFDRSVLSLPQELQTLQGKVLATLGAQICALPNNQAEVALKDFIAVARAHTGSKSRLLNDLLKAAAEGIKGLKEREDNLVSENGEATRAVRAGQNVIQAAEYYGISRPELVKNMEIYAMDLACEMVKGGGFIPDVMERYGLGHSQSRQSLENEAASLNAPGGAAALCGRNILLVAQQFGISLPDYGLIGLQEQATSRLSAGYAMVLRGQEPEAVAKKLGITHHECIFKLRNAVTVRDLPGRQAIIDGCNVSDFLGMNRITGRDLPRHYQALTCSYGSAAHRAIFSRQGLSRIQASLEEAHRFLRELQGRYGITITDDLRDLISVARVRGYLGAPSLTLVDQALSLQCDDLKNRQCIPYCS